MIEFFIRKMEWAHEHEGHMWLIIILLTVIWLDLTW